ncbi:MAG: phosphotransferase [Fimbriimonadales bacterium]
MFSFPNPESPVIDFDDLGWAHHAYDYAVTLSQFRGKDNFEHLREAYGEGYSKARPLPKDWRERLEVFMAARVLMMTEWLFSREDNPRLRSWRDKMLPRRHGDLEKYVATGSLR